MSTHTRHLQVLGTASDVGKTSVAIDERTDALRQTVVEAHDRLAEQHDFLVIEGCGSPVELNIKERDFVNFWVADRFDATCVLVANVENVGVFGSIVGTLALLSDEERARIAGFVINKFHGDPNDFADGAAILEERTGVRCLGVIPYLAELQFLAKEGAPGEDVGAGGFDDEVGRWTEHVVAHLDEQFLQSLVA